MTQPNSTTPPTKAEKRERAAAEKAEKALAKYEAKSQKALEKAQARASTPQLKERVIHTRVPAALEEQLKAHADRLRVPVSNLIRIVLENAMKGPLELHGPAPTAGREVRVLGYQPFFPAVATPCSRCGRTLAPGAEAYLGLTDPPGARVIACPACIPNPRAAVPA